MKNKNNFFLLLILKHFRKYVLNKSEGIGDIGGINW
jgi:hypothetical protein